MGVAGDTGLGVSSQEKLTQWREKRAQNRMQAPQYLNDRWHLNLSLQPSPQTFLQHNSNQTTGISFSNDQLVHLQVFVCLVGWSVGWLAFLT